MKAKNRKLLAGAFSGILPGLEEMFQKALVSGLGLAGLATLVMINS